MPLWITSGRQPDTCDIQSCTGSRDHLVARFDDTRGVCTKCMEELVAVSGWVRLGLVNKSTSAYRLG